MSKLLSTYAKSTGLKIGNMYLREHFFPVPFEKYITIQTGSGQASKNYDYYQEVIAILKPILDQNGITLVHIGAKEDPQLNGVYDLRGKTSIPQSAYIIKRAAVHLGNDSWIQHYSCFNKVPTIVLFGSTSPANHGSYWENDKTIFMESHRSGNKPTFSQEHIKTINFIQPEKVVENVVKLLGGNIKIPFNTVFIGDLYNQVMLEVLPNFVLDNRLMPQLPIALRMDLEFNEENLVEILKTGRRVNLITKKSVNPNILNSFRAQILSYNEEVSLNTDVNQINIIKSIIPNHRFYTKLEDEEEIKKIRFKFFDIIQVMQVKDMTKDQVLEASARFLNKSLDDLPKIDTLGFKSNKYILSEGQIYTSFAHLKSKKPIPSFDQNMSDVIDDEDFWRDSNNFYIIEKHEQAK